MERLNYHHLLYFYTVAHEGTVARASSRLGLKQPTVSSQIHALEKKLGQQLLERSGRGLKVTAAGKTVLRYAESIFALGGEMVSVLEGEPVETAKLAVGVSSSLPQALVAPLVQSLLVLKPTPVLTVEEGTTETLGTRVASRSVLFALDDVPQEAQGGLQSRVLLECAVELFAPAAIAANLRKNIPARLSSVPVLMPGSVALRREVESWIAFRKQTVKKLAEMPRAEMYAAANGAAMFAPTLLRESLKKSYGLLPVAELEGSRWRLFAIMDSKSVRHPGLNAVVRAAKSLR
ncbi:MAG TPA: LysR family transcriptional regulator [Candidatus Saccharimonadales bacterium]|nr:LysR family transcriptional regulator [Candidatus Saccharimonadales bacterium]